MGTYNMKHFTIIEAEFNIGKIRTLGFVFPLTADAVMVDVNGAEYICASLHITPRGTIVLDALKYPTMVAEARKAVEATLYPGSTYSFFTQAHLDELIAEEKAESISARYDLNGNER
jgi:hypothetical protein